MTPIASGDPSSPFVALTFDDGPDQHETRHVLSFLAAQNVPATFFLCGQEIARFPEIAAEIAAAGHEVANHTYSHFKLPELTPGAMYADVDLCSRLIETTTGHAPRFFRPPFGALNDHVLAVAAVLRMQTVLWSIAAGDWQDTPEVGRVVDNINAATGGSIIACHDKRPQIVDALSVCIPFLRSKNLEFVTLSRLLQSA